MGVVQFSANTELLFQELETEPQVNSVMCSIDEEVLEIAILTTTSKTLAN